MVEVDAGVQYYKGGRALRTETTINNANDFGIGKRLSCLPQLGRVGYQATVVSSTSNALARRFHDVVA